MKKIATTFGMLALVSVTSFSYAQQGGTTNPSGSTSQGGAMSQGGSTSLGKMSKVEFNRKNAWRAASVLAIKPTDAPLSETDKQLMLEVALGGMMQLEVSKIAMQKATNESVRTLAQGEVDEQTGLLAKLKEIAAAKRVALPAMPDAQTKAMISKMQGLSGAEFDRAYAQESGVNGHQKLDKVMTMVKSNASDSNLKALATAAHPLVKTHLQVSQDLLRTMSSNGTSGGTK